MTNSISKVQQALPVVYSVITYRLIDCQLIGFTSVSQQSHFSLTEGTKILNNTIDKIGCLEHILFENDSKSDSDWKDDFYYDNTDYSYSSDEQKINDSN